MEAHKEMPYALHHQTITEDMLSPFARDCYNGTAKGKSYKSKKLVATFLERKNYVAHYSQIKAFKAAGLIIKKIHRGFRFKQEAIIKPYIDNLTEKRSNATSVFEKNNYKLMANSLYGKMLETGKNRLRAVLVRSSRRAQALIAHPLFKAYKIIQKNM